jgi:hypothetical protein
MRILISHATEDEHAASLLKQLIQRCSLRQIDVWFSSDQSPQGGIALGASWFLDLCARLIETDIIVALVTPNSTSSPWIYFECGFVASKGKANIVPLTLGMSLNDLPMPLSAYQGYDLSTSNGATVFLQKLFDAARIPYDEEMTLAIRRAVSQELAASGNDMGNAARKPREVERADIETLRQYLDMRFLELHKAISPKQTNETTQSEAIVPVGTTINFVVWRDNTRVKKFTVGCPSDSSIQDILDACYFQMAKLVGAYKYLISWLIEEESTGRKLITEGVDDRDRPASSYFDPTKQYVIKLLNEPYNPAEESPAGAPNRRSRKT